MPSRCCLRGCKSKHNESDPRNPNLKIAFFTFKKKDLKILQNWIDYVRQYNGTPDWKPKDKDRICSMHFILENLESNGVRPKKDAIPVLYTLLPNKQMDKHESIKLIEETMKSFTDATLQQEYANELQSMLSLYQGKQSTKRVFLPPNTSSENIVESPPAKKSKIIYKEGDKTFTPNQPILAQIANESIVNQINYSDACSTINMDDFYGKTDLSNCNENQEKEIDYNYSGKTFNTEEEINYGNNNPSFYDPSYPADEVDSIVNKTFDQLHSYNYNLTNVEETSAAPLALEPTGLSTDGTGSFTLNNYNVNNDSIHTNVQDMYASLVFEAVKSYNGSEQTNGTLPFAVI